MIVTNVLALVLAAALNPLVARAPEPRGNTPADCEVSGAAPMPRITVAEADPVFEDQPAMPPPPVRSTTKVPAATTSADVGELKRALAANDRAAFDLALARAKADGVATRVYDDIARLWDAQFESPFFAEDSDAHRVARSYPGYEEAVRRQIYTDARGQKFYPAAESRAFVATHVGMRSPATRAVNDARSRATSPRTTTTTTTTKTPSSTRSTTSVNTGSTRISGNTGSTKSSGTTRSTKTASSTRSTKTASREPVASRKTASPRSPDPSASPRIAATAPAPVASRKVVDTSTTEAPPAAGILEPEPDSDPVPPASDTAVTETTVTETTDTTFTDTTATTATDTDTAVTTPAETTTTSAKTGATRPILIPAILILIGLGVLILLFRTKT